MPVAALVTWIITALLGSTMAATWASRGGLRQHEGGASHFRPPVVFGHLGLAVAGLVVWIVYLVDDSQVLAWVAFVDLLVVAGIGDLLVYRWFRDRREGDETITVRGAPGTTTLAEQRIPSPVVVAHGVFAVATIVLVLLAALEVGE